jgi:hypothetical protein
LDSAEDEKQSPLIEERQSHPAEEKQSPPAVVDTDEQLLLRASHVVEASTGAHRGGWWQVEGVTVDDDPSTVSLERCCKVEGPSGKKLTASRWKNPFEVG